MPHARLCHDQMICWVLQGLQPALARGMLVALAAALRRVYLDGGPMRWVLRQLVLPPHLTPPHSWTPRLAGSIGMPDVPRTKQWTHGSQGPAHQHTRGVAECSPRARRPADDVVPLPPAGCTRRRMCRRCRRTWTAPRRCSTPTATACPPPRSTSSPRCAAQPELGGLQRHSPLLGPLAACQLC